MFSRTVILSLYAVTFLSLAACTPSVVQCPASEAPSGDPEPTAEAGEESPNEKAKVAKRSGGDVEVDDNRDVLERVQGTWLFGEIDDRDLEGKITFKGEKVLAAFARAKIDAEARGIFDRVEHARLLDRLRGRAGGELGMPAAVLPLFLVQAVFGARERTIL